MKVLTSNFLTCPVTPCRSSPLSFPLHFRDAELVRTPTPYNALFLRNLLPRLEWEALRSTAAELGFTTLPETMPELPPLIEHDQRPERPSETESSTEDESETQPKADGQDRPDTEVEMIHNEVAETEKILKDLHTLLLETRVEEGSLVCGNCGHEFKIHQGIANFLLPSHLV